MYLSSFGSSFTDDPLSGILQGRDHFSRRIWSPIAHAIGIILAGVRMRFEAFSFGSIRINGTTYEHDVVIDHGQVRKRNKKPSKRFRDAFGHTPLSVDEEIPWKCRRLVIGTGTGALPVMDEVKREAARRKIELLVLPTTKAIAALRKSSDETNAILHVTS